VWVEIKGKRIKHENGLLKRGENRENRPLYFGECRGGVLVGLEVCACCPASDILHMAAGGRGFLT